MSVLNQLSSSLSVLSSKMKTFLALASFLRMGLNLLDFGALGLVGVIAFLVANPGKDFEGNVPVGNLHIVFKISEVPLLAVVACLMFLLKSVFSVVFSLRYYRAVSDLEHKFAREWLDNHFLHTNAGDNYPDAPEIHSTLMRSLNALITGILTSLVTIFSEGTLLLVLVLGFVALNPIAATLLVAYLGCVVGTLSFLIFPKIEKASRADYLASHRMLSLTRDYIQSRKSIFLQGANESWLRSIAIAKNIQIQNANRGLALTALPRNLIETALILGVFGFLGLAMLYSDIPSQAVTIGIFLVGGLRLVSAILPLQAAVGVLKQSLASTEYALNGLKLVSRDTSQPRLASDDFEIVVDSVGHSRFDSGFELKNISFRIPFGSKFAIVGPSGAGKSTLGEIILGLQEPTAGTVKIGGIDASKLVNSPRHYLAYVPQRSDLIEGTLAENVSLLKDSEAIDRHLVERVLELSGLSSLRERLPLGLDTVISHGGTNLSGGEMQRLGLARALYTEPKIIVLDEATSALDAETEHYVSRILESFHGNKTLIVIAHRLATIVDADCIAYLDNGELRGTGTYEDLIASVPSFASAVELLGTRSGRAD